MTHDELVLLARKWLSKQWCNAANEGHTACPVVLSEMTAYTYYGEVPDVIGWHSRGCTVIECKASRSDFKADTKKLFRANSDYGMGTQRYYMVPVGLIELDEIPPGWGLITVKDGRCRVVKTSGGFKSHTRSEVSMLISLIRRFKIEPGKHVAINAYTIENEKEPRATVMIGVE